MQVRLNKVQWVVKDFKLTVIRMLNFKVEIWDTWVLKTVKEPKGVLQS
jgi:hypothetical protein